MGRIISSGQGKSVAKSLLSRLNGETSDPEDPSGKEPALLDPRYRKLAEVIARHSCAVQKGERILIETFDIPSDFIVTLIRTLAEAGGMPLCLTKHNAVLRELYSRATEEQMRLWGQVERL